MRNPLYLRLRPFLRRDIRARLVSALFAVLVLSGLGWLGISALTNLDSQDAHRLRIGVGLERQGAVCGGLDQPQCAYDDREQGRVDRIFTHEQRIRLAVLDELHRRTEHGLDRLKAAQAMARQMQTDRGGALVGDTAQLRNTLIEAVVDLRPAPVASVASRRQRLLWPLEDYNSACTKVDGELGLHGRPCAPVVPMRTQLVGQISLERTTLTDLRARTERLIQRDSGSYIAFDPASRSEALLQVLPGGPSRDATERLELAAWLAVRPPHAVSWEIFDAVEDAALMSSGIHNAASESGLGTISGELATLSNAYPGEVHAAATDLRDAVWHAGWLDPAAEFQAIEKASVRYHSPVSGAARLQLFGAGLFLLAGILLVVVGPVVTATNTAREREAGTLPVLRMTGLSAGDLALAMAIGPNVFALVAGGALLAIAVPILAFTAGPLALIVPLATLIVLSAATHLTAIGLGDALGQRVNALIVGGVIGLGLMGVGLVGTVMVVGDMAATGFMFGPLPAVLAGGFGLSGLPYAAQTATFGSSEHGALILQYALGLQVMLGALCLLSWRRRVELAWAPLFRPLEGVLLALGCVGCSALAVLDLSVRIDVQTYDQANLVTFVAIGFLMPLLGWLLVSSLVRPARASAVASSSEVRRAFWRFQLFVALSAGALAMAYMAVLERTDLAGEESELMWATLAQGLLVAETAVATLLLASRRASGRHRVVALGGLVVMLQAAFTIGVYNLEVEHVALTQASGNPLLIGMGSSPYWLAFLVVLWAAGLGLILAALLRERDRADASHARAEADEDVDGPNRWLH